MLKFSDINPLLQLCIPSSIFLKQYFWQALFALPVWSAAYKQAGLGEGDWSGVSQVDIYPFCCCSGSGVIPREYGLLMFQFDISPLRLSHMQTLLEAPGVGKVAKYTPAYDGPSFRECDVFWTALAVDLLPCPRGVP